MVNSTNLHTVFSQLQSKKVGKVSADDVLLTAWQPTWTLRTAHRDSSHVRPWTIAKTQATTPLAVTTSSSPRRQL